MNTTKQTNKRLTITQEKTLFAVFTNTDLTEGRGQEYIAALAEKEITARRLAKGKYVQGSDARVQEVTAYFVPTNKKFPSIGKWLAPIGFVHAPSREDEANEKAFLELKAKNLLLEKFKKGENLTKEEREKIVDWLK